MTESVVDRSIGVNESVAEMESKGILLNVLRAKDHMPMVFTGISGIKFDAPSIEATTELAMPFGRGGDHKYSLTPSFKSNYKLDYEVGVFQTHDFIRGIMKPLSVDQLKYFWDMGFSKKLLLHLFVREVRCYQINDDSRLTLINRFTNYPGDKVEYNKFSCEMHRMVADGLDMVIREDDFVNGDEIDDKNNKQVVLFVNNKYDAEKAVWSAPCAQKESEIIRDYVITLPPERKGIKWNKILGLDKKKNKKIAVLYLRSTESVMYYLGEIVREQLEPKKPISSVANNMPDLRFFIYEKPDKGAQPIFLVRQLDQSVNKKDVSASGSYDGIDPQCSQAVLRQDDDVLVKVEYGGKEYCVPKENGKTMEVMSLVSLLIGMNKSADDLPKTSVIQLTP